MDLKTRLKDLVDLKAKQLQVDLSWFKYAVPTPHGHTFLPDHPARSTALMEICQAAHQDYPDLTYGQIQDALADVVNQE